MPNKRQGKRYIRRCEVEFSVEGSVYRGIASDFSLKGMFIRTNNPVKPGFLLNLVIFYPDGQRSGLTVRVKRALKTASFKVRGRPIREMKSGMGVEIIERDSSYLNFIRSLIPELKGQ